jgi:acetylornithine deacetylase
MIEKLGDKWLDFLVRLVQTLSVLGDERACQAMVRQAMEELGVFERMVYPGNEPPFHPTGRSYEDRGCVVGRIPGNGGAPAFILNAHIDTAPVEDPASWLHPPFAGVIEDGRLYGRGALDDKAGVAMILLIAEVLRQSGLTLPGDVILESVIEDEDSGNGTLACTQAGYFAEAGIVIDGTWPFRIIEAHLGQLWLNVEVRGVPAPACSLARAKDPVATAIKVVQAIKALIASKNVGLEWRGLREPDFCCVGAIHAGVWAGAVPESCRLALQVGFAPPDMPEGMLEDIRNAVTDAVPEFADCGTIEVGSLCTPAFANGDNAMVRILKRTIERLHPDEMEVRPVTVSGHCDLRHMRKSDGSPAEACLYGPGGGANPHCADEFYMLEHFVPVAKNIMSAMLRHYHVI